MKNIHQIAVLALVVALASCSKKSDPAPPPVIEITDKNWKLTSATATTQLGPIDVYSKVDDCIKDNIYKFNKDQTLTEDEGATKCKSTDPQSVSGTWILSADRKMLTITDNTGTRVFNNLDIKEKTIQGSYEDPSYLGVTVLATFTAQ